MPTTTASTGLSGLVFTDPHHDPTWARAIVPAQAPALLPAARRGLDVVVHGAGRSHDLAEWNVATSTTSLLVLDAAGVVHESYAGGLDTQLGPETLFLGASMTKSVLAHLVGVAVRDGALSLGDRTVDRVPELAGSGYDGTTVLDLLTMTTGVDWVEDHRDADSLASRLLRCFPDQQDSRALLGRVRAGVRPGIRWNYCTADSQVLDWVRERATGQSYPDAATDLWQALGCERDAVVALDGDGVALAGGGLAAATRDWARVARLMVNGEPVLDHDWVEAAARPAYPFLGVGRLPSTITTHAGFGYHWWPMDDAGRRVTADGSRGQFACVDRSTGAVVVKTSLWPYEDAWADRQCRDLSYLGLHALLDAVAPTPEREGARP